MFVPLQLYLTLQQVYESERKERRDGRKGRGGSEQAWQDQLLLVGQEMMGCIVKVITSDGCFFPLYSYFPFEYITMCYHKVYEMYL